MHLPSVESDIDITELNSEIKQYEIGDPHIIIMILRQGIYKNPLKAVVQEYMSNAVDAHAEAGKSNVPIEITFPDVAFGNPELWIRDFGIGINPDRWNNVFTQLGKSTKRNSTDQIGGFGLGCKVGFAYAESFVVETVYETPAGRFKDVYFNFINQDKRSGNTRLSSTPTTDPTGTLIKIAIDEADYDMVRVYVKRVGMFWKTTPNCTNEAITFEREPTLCAANDGSWELFKTSKTPTIVINSIPYDFNKEMFSGESAEVKRLLDYGIVLHISGTAVPVTASREDIDYSAATVGFIAEWLGSIVEELDKKIEEMYSFFGWRDRLNFYKERGMKLDGVVEDLDKSIYYVFHDIGLQVRRLDGILTSLPKKIEHSTCEILLDSVVILVDNKSNYKSKVNAIYRDANPGDTIFLITSKRKFNKEEVPEILQVAKKVISLSEIKTSEKDIKQRLEGTARITLYTGRRLKYNDLKEIPLETKIEDGTKIKGAINYRGAILLIYENGYFRDKDDKPLGDYDVVTKRGIRFIIVTKLRFKMLQDRGYLGLFKTIDQVSCLRIKRRGRRDNPSAKISDLYSTELARFCYVLSMVDPRFLDSLRELQKAWQAKLVAVTRGVNRPKKGWVYPPLQNAIAYDSLSWLRIQNPFLRWVLEQKRKSYYSNHTTYWNLTEVISVIKEIYTDPQKKAAVELLLPYFGKVTEED